MPVGYFIAPNVSANAKRRSTTEYIANRDGRIIKYLQFTQLFPRKTTFERHQVTKRCTNACSSGNDALVRKYFLHNCFRPQVSLGGLIHYKNQVSFFKVAFGFNLFLLDSQQWQVLLGPLFAKIGTTGIAVSLCPRNFHVRVHAPSKQCLRIQQVQVRWIVA